MNIRFATIQLYTQITLFILIVYVCVCVSYSSRAVIVQSVFNVLACAEVLLVHFSVVENALSLVCCALLATSSIAILILCSDLDHAYLSLSLSLSLTKFHILRNARLIALSVSCGVP